jgi:hypothetical protein
MGAVAPLSRRRAARAVLLTIGKYGTAHTSFDLKDGRQFNPYELNTDLTAADFTQAEQDTWTAAA